MKLLILGGTRFLGRALVEAALRAGDEVTLFNRGVSNPQLFPLLETIQGDRDGGLATLHSRRWDAVIDTCGYVPRLVGDAARMLADAVELYTFVSSISVYADPVTAGGNEQAPLAITEDPATEEITGESYGPLKALCEEKALAEMNGRALLVRAGLIVGPHDTTDRFTYWPVRAAYGGEILAPGIPTAPVQFIDVRDLASWTLRATRARLTGPYNVTGPVRPISLSGVLDTCRRVGDPAATLTWVSEQFLLAEGVQPWSDLPLWVPAADSAFLQVDISKALAAGLATRPLVETVRDTLDWAHTRPHSYEWQAGISLQREADLLDAWHAQRA